MPSGPWEAKLGPKYLKLSCEGTDVQYLRNGQCQHPKEQIMFYGAGAYWICRRCSKVSEFYPPYCMGQQHVPGDNPEACECGEQRWDLNHEHVFIKISEGDYGCRICGVVGQPLEKDASPQPQLQRRHGHPQEHSFRKISELESLFKGLSHELTRFFGDVIIFGHNSLAREPGERPVVSLAVVSCLFRCDSICSCSIHQHTHE